MEKWENTNEKLIQNEKIRAKNLEQKIRAKNQLENSLHFADNLFITDEITNYCSTFRYAHQADEADTSFKFKNQSE